jgi:hypothetical protein
MRCLARDEGERDVDQRDREDEQEMRGMVLHMTSMLGTARSKTSPMSGSASSTPRSQTRGRSCTSPPWIEPVRARARSGGQGADPSGAHARLRIVGYVSRAPPEDPRRAIERAWPADRLASRLRIGDSTDTEARWRVEAATSCWEPPSAGSVPSRARRRGGVAPRSDVRRCCRRTTARRRASYIRLRPGGHRSRGRSRPRGV